MADPNEHVVNQHVSSPKPGLHEGLEVALEFPFKGSIEVST